MDEAVVSEEGQLQMDTEDRAVSLPTNNTGPSSGNEEKATVQETCVISEELASDKKVPPPRTKHKRVMSKSTSVRLSSAGDARSDAVGSVSSLARSSSLDHVMKRRSQESVQPHSVMGATGSSGSSDVTTNSAREGGSLASRNINSVLSRSGAITGTMTHSDELTRSKCQLSMPSVAASSSLGHLSSPTSAASTDSLSKPWRDISLPEVCTPMERSSSVRQQSAEPPKTSVVCTKSASGYVSPLYSASTSKVGSTSLELSHLIGPDQLDKSSDSRQQSSLRGTSPDVMSLESIKTKKLTKGYLNHNDKSASLSPIVIKRKLSRLCYKDDDECVGFASLPEQVHRKAVKRGFDFTLMAVGDSGLGKSTLISSLFLNPELYKDRKLLDSKDRINRTVEIEKKYMEIEEKGVKLRLTIIDTPGFNDGLDAEQSSQPIEKYINQQFEQYFKDESGLNRKNIKDNRVHCCLYFISPYGHGLRQTDIIFIKRLQDKVNIVPVIGKADTLTPSEVIRLKEKILEQIEEHNLQIYEFPDCDSDEDEDFKQQDAELKAAIPFAVIGSNTVVEVNGRKVRGRLYPWGVVEVDNPQHCDFSKLRMMLISTHMQDLKDVTRDVHYENFRAKQIKEQMTRSQRERNNQPGDFYKISTESSSTDSKLKRDSSPNFESIMDQSQLLEQKEEEIRRMQEMIVKMQAQLQNSKRVNGAISNGDNNL